MSLVTGFRVGGLACHALEAGLQRLDGGAMFGVVPKPLWERRIAADERNRIPLALRCLLVEHPDGLVLCDTGIGNKEDEKFRDIYAVENAGRSGRTQLEDALREAGFSPEDVRWVINTHLHFDHCGGNTYVDVGASGRADPRVAGSANDAPPSHRRPADQSAIRLSFPNATYVVQRGELEFGMAPHERARASYLRPNFVPVTEAGRWRLVRGEIELLPGIRLVPTPGHVPHHQSILLEDRGERALYLGDLVPTSAHLPLPWIMGYDLEPLVTLETKRGILARAEAEGWLLVFEHDPVVPVGRVVREGKSYACAPLDTVSRGG
ncbi:MAG TPA: MBL fold metallo-hydrolase [Gemmatimonadales bacterium]|nr:MBL fold metallo-hydrolase [Gemmatimonadales bacterium]